MTAIHVSRAQVDALLAGCPVIVVEGEWDHDDSVGLYGTSFFAPPADLVAATEATCWCSSTDRLLPGLVWAHGPHPDGSSGKYVDCPDCIDGRPWVDLVVGCETCGGQHSAQSPMPGYWRNGRIVNVAGGCAFVTVTCPDCTDGQRTVARVQISEVVPIVGESEDCEPWQHRVEVTDQGLLLHHTARHDVVFIDSLTRWLPAIAPDGPESIVGKWAAVITDARAL